jgi:hypothetical protein
MSLSCTHKERGVTGEKTLILHTAGPKQDDYPPATEVLNSITFTPPITSSAPEVRPRIFWRQTHTPPLPIVIREEPLGSSPSCQKGIMGDEAMLSEELMQQMGGIAGRFAW